MRCWVLAVGLGCAQTPVPVALEPAPPSTSEVAQPVVPAGPSRADVVAMLETQSRVGVPGLSGGWMRVGTHLGERVLKPVCGGEVPRIGLKLDGLGGRLHAFDGHRMVVHQILGIVPAAEGGWRVWMVPQVAQRPVYTVYVNELERGITRWRGTSVGPDWADGADWVKEPGAAGLVRVEQLDCRPDPR